MTKILNSPDLDKLTKPFRRKFAPSPYAPFAIEGRRGWVTEQRNGIYLTDDKVSAHLSGQYYVGPVNRTFAASLAIDLDAHDGRHRRTLDRRMDKVMSAFPEAAPLVFSTPGGGRHLHYMLDRPGWSACVHAFGTNRLRAAGVELGPGSVEVFPDGDRALRAPLGRDCWLLDVDSRLPVDGHRAANLDALRGILERGQYDTLTIPEDYGATAEPLALPTRRRGSSFMAECDRLLSQGLPGPGTRNDSLMKLRWLFMAVWNLPPDRAELELWAWLQNGHNGHSRDYNASPDRCRRHIREIVRSHDPAKVGAGRQRRTEPRTPPKDAIERYCDLQPLDGRERAFLGRLLVYAHQYGQTTMTNEIDVQIPSRTLKTFDRQYGPVLRVLESQDIVVRVRNHGAQIHRCATYRAPCLQP